MQEKTIDLVRVTEHDDGTATLTFDISEDMKDALVQYALKDIFTKIANKEILDNQCYV